ncbi:MAG: hypothetical protein HRU09_15575 [Oligoflexales bacterium]|nr:hypothetical protein [Oligoflexales bacterium]
MLLIKKSKLIMVLSGLLCSLILFGCGLNNQKPIRTSVGSVGIAADKKDEKSEDAKKQDEEQEDLTLDELVSTNEEIAKIQEEIRQINEKMSSQLEKQGEFDTRLSELEASIAEKEEKINALDVRLQSVEEQVKIIAALRTAVIALEERIIQVELSAVKKAEFDLLKQQVEELSENQSGTVAIIKTIVSGLTMLATDIGFPIADMIMGS